MGSDRKINPPGSRTNQLPAFLLQVAQAHGRTQQFDRRANDRTVCLKRGEFKQTSTYKAICESRCIQNVALLSLQTPEGFG
jgi:hypothetical protein